MGLTKEQLEEALKEARNNLEKATTERQKYAEIESNLLKTVSALEHLLKVGSGNTGEVTPKPRTKKLSEYKRATDAVFVLLSEASPHPLALREILEKLEAHGRILKKDSLWIMLHKDPRFKKVGRGIFGLADGQEKSRKE